MCIVHRGVYIYIYKRPVRVGFFFLGFLSWKAVLAKGLCEAVHKADALDSRQGQADILCQPQMFIPISHKRVSALCFFFRRLSYIWWLQKSGARGGELHSLFPIIVLEFLFN